MAINDQIVYEKNEIIIKNLPKAGENFNVFVQPQDTIKFSIDINKPTYQLVGGDVVMHLPNGSTITFVSMGILAFEEQNVVLKFPSSVVTLNDILFQIDDIKETPAESVITDDFVALSDEFSDEKPQELEENSNITMILNDNPPPSELPKYQNQFEDERIPIPEEIETTDFNAVYRPQDDNPINVAISEVENAVQAGLKFGIDLFQTQKIEDNPVTPTNIDGGGGSIYGGNVSTPEAQFQAEKLDYSAQTGPLLIEADNPTLFDNTGVLSRTLRINPEQPTGFGITAITISSLPNGYEIVGAINEGNGTWSIPPSSDGTVMTGFTVNSATGAADFVLKYSPLAEGTRIDSIFSFTTTFNQANVPPGQSVQDPDITQLSGTDSIQFVMKEIRYDFLPSGNDPGGAIDYIDLAGDGFVLATNANYNVITTSQGDSTVIGAEGKDTIIGLQGDDTLSGAGHDDTLSGGLGTNILDGGSDNAGDTVSYAYLDGILGAVGAEVDLLAGTGSSATGVGANDTLSTIENVLGSVFVDTISGDNSINILDGALGDDTLFGLGGNDTLLGNSGNDTLFGGLGDDLIDGGDDIDVVSYKTSGSGITAVLRTDIDGSATGEGSDVLRNVENLIGSDNNDNITGSESANLLQGEAGIDTILGGDGDDTVFGGDDVDSLFGGGDNDTLYGDLGNDSLFGDTENDQLFGGDGLDSLDGGDGDDILDGGIDNDSLYGNNGNDTLLGDDGNDILDGAQGDDSLYGGFGDDTLFASIGTDFIQGDAGLDTLSYQNLTTASISLDLTKQSEQVLKNADGKFDTINDDGGGLATDVYDVESIIGTNFEDVMIGNDSDNSFEGAGSADILIGNGGADYLSGGNNDDTFEGGAGADSFVGGTQIDTITYINDAAGTTIDLFNKTALDGNGDTDTFIEIENAIGSNFVDIITGDNGDNVLDGSGGDDTFIASIGNDTVIGGDGFDFIDFTDNTVLVPGGYGVNIDLDSNATPIGGGGLYNHNISSIEGVVGTGARDIIRGNASDNIIFGGGSSDTIYGENGTNILYGGLNDGSASGNDLIAGGSGVDTIFGEDGNDVLYDSDGDDTFDGGTGSDRVDYRNGANGSGGITINLTDQGSGFGEATDTYGKTDYIVLNSVETIYGSATTDTIVGDANNNSIYGYEGNDSISGGDGQDSLRGAQGNDSISGGLGNDSITGDSGNDILDGDSGVDIIHGGSEDDIIDGGSDGDTLFGDSGDDTIDGGSGVDTLNGGADADILRGGSENDVFTYTANASEVAGDTIDGGLNTDTIYTSGGNDYDFSNATITDTEVLQFVDSGTQTNTITDEQFNAGLTTVIDGTGTNTLNIKVESSPVFDASGITRNGLDSLYINGTLGVATNLTLTGSSGVDTIAGSSGDDIFTGLDGADTLLGNSGDDTIVGDINGGNIIDGGLGSDTLDYSAFTPTAGLNISLEGTTQTSVTGGDLLASDTISNIENVFGSSNSDTITVTQNENNTLVGNGGDDDFILANASGNGSGNVYDGGTGTDQVFVNESSIFFGATFTGIEEMLFNSGSTQSIAIYDTQVAQIDTIVGNAQTNTLNIYANTNFDASTDVNATGVEEFILRANAGTDQQLTSGAGNYTVISASNDDTLISNDGNDSFIGGDGDDTFIANINGSDRYEGESGDDIFQFNAAELTNTNTVIGGETGETSGDTLEITDQVTGGNLVDADFTNVSEIETIQFANTNNDITLDQDSITLQGGSSTDNFNYADANFSATDTIDGGAGQDTLTITDAASLVAGDLTNVSSVEVLSLSNNTNTVNVVGMADPFETILGGTGIDSITTNGGENTVASGAGDDTVFISSASDTLDGGADTDVLNITGNVDLSSSTVINFESIVTDSDLAMTVEQYNTFTSIDVAGNDVTIVGNGTDDTMSASTIVNEGASTKLVFTNGLNLTTTVNDIDVDIDASAADVTLNLNTADTDDLTITTGVSATLNVDASSLTANKTINLEGTGGATVTLGNDANLNSTSSGNIIVNDGSGNNIITTGSGVDIINLSAGGADLVTTGSGNDTINLSQNILSIDGGLDSDTLNVLTTSTIGSLSSVETLNIQATNDLTAYDLTDVLTLDVDNGNNFSSITATMTISQYLNLTSANISKGIDDIIALENVNGDISSSDLSKADSLNLNADTQLSVAQAIQFSGNITKNSNILTVLDSQTNIEVANFTDLVTAGVDFVDSTNGTLNITIAQATTSVDFMATDTVTIVDSNANLTIADFSTLAANIDSIDATDAVSITVAQANDINTYGISFAITDSVTVVDSAAAIQAADFAALASVGVDVVDSTSDALTLSITQATAGIDFTAGDTVTVTGTGADLVTAIGSYETGVDFLDASDNTATITVANTSTLSAAGTSFVAGDVVTVVDTAVAIEAANFATLASVGVDTVDSTDNTLDVSITQATAGIDFTAADVVTVTDTQAAIEASNFANLFASNVDILDSTDDALDVTVAEATSGLTFTAGDLITVVDSAAAIQAADFAALASVGVDVVDSTSDALTLSITQATTSITFTAADVVTVTGTGAALVSDIGNYATGVDFLDASDNVATITVAQATTLDTDGISFVAGDVVTISDTQAAIEGADFATLASVGVDIVDSSNDVLNLSITQATTSIAFTAADVVTVTGTGANLVSDIGNYATGVDILDATDNVATITAANAATLDTASTVFAAGDVVTLSDTQAAIEATTFATLVATGVDILDSTDDALDVTVSEATSGLTFTAGDLITVVDSAAAIQAADFAALASVGVDVVDSTSDALTLSITQATAGIDFTAGDTVTVTGTGADLVTAIGSYETGVDFLDASDNTATITVANTSTLSAAGTSFVAGDVVTVVDTAVAIEAANFATLASVGVDTVDSTDNTLDVSITQATAGIDFTAADVVTVTDTQAAIEASNFANLFASNVDILDSTDDALDVTVAEATSGLTFTAGDLITVVDSAAAIQAADFAALASVGVDVVDSTSDALTLSITQATTSITFTAADVVTVTGTGAALVSDIGNYATGVDFLDASDNVATITVAQATTLDTDGISFVAGDVVTISDTQAAIEGADFATLASVGVDIVDSSNDVLNLSITQATTSIAFTAADVVTVTGTGANLVSDIGNYATGVDILDATDNVATITAANAATLDTASTVFAAGDVVTLSDTQAAIEATTFATLVATGVDILDSTDDALDVTVSEATSGLTFTAGDLITVVDSAAAIQAADFAALASVGVDVVDSTSDALTLSITQATAGIDFTAGDTVTVTGTGADLVTAIGSYETGVDFLDASDNTATITVANTSTLSAAGTSFVAGDVVTVVDTAVAIEAANFATLASVGVDTVDSTDNTLDVSITQATAGIDFTAGDLVTMSGSGDISSDTLGANIDNIEVTGAANTLIMGSNQLDNQSYTKVGTGDLRFNAGTAGNNTYTSISRSAGTVTMVVASTLALAVADDLGGISNLELDANLEVDTAHLSGKTIAVNSSLSNVMNIDASSALDYSALTKTGNASVVLDVNGNFDQASNSLGAIDTINVDAVLGIDGSLINGTSLVFTGAGTLNVNVDNTTDLSSLDVSGFSGATVNITDSAGTHTITGSALAENFIISSGGSNTVNAGNGDDNFDVTNTFTALNGQEGSDSFNIDDATPTYSGTIDGGTTGSNVDVVNINAAGTDLSGVSLIDIETININQNSTLNSTQMLGSALDATGAGGSVEVTLFDSGALDFSALTQTGIDSLQFANVANDITIDENGVELKAGSAGDNFNYANADFTSADTITGGAGTDSISFNDGMSKDYETDFANVNSVENLVGSTSADSFSLDFSSVATAFSFNGQADDQNDTVFIQSSIDLSVGDQSIADSAFTNIKTLDLDSATFAGATGRLALTSSNLTAWTDVSGATDTFTINLKDDTTQNGLVSFDGVDLNVGNTIIDAGGTGIDLYVV